MSMVTKEYPDKKNYPEITIKRKRNYREWEHFKTLLPIIGSLIFSVDTIIIGSLWIARASVNIVVFFVIYIIMGVGLVLTGIKFYDFYKERNFHLPLAIFIIFLGSGTLMGLYPFFPLVALSHLSGLFILLGIYYLRYCKYNEFHEVFSITSILSLAFGIAHITLFFIAVYISGSIWDRLYGLGLLLLGAVGNLIGFIIYIEPIEKSVEKIIKEPAETRITATVPYCPKCGISLENYERSDNCPNCGWIENGE